MNLRIEPTTLRAANAFVASHHRHHKPVRGCVFVTSIVEGIVVRGVLIAGRPVARMLSDEFTLEVNRCCTDGVRNGCSILYGVAARVAFQLGYRRIITYTLPEEGGASLRASGWTFVSQTRGGTWDRKGRAREDDHPTGPKLLWERTV